MCGGGHHWEHGKAAALGPNSPMAAALRHQEADNRPRGSEEESLEGSCVDKRSWGKEFEEGGVDGFSVPVPRQGKRRGMEGGSHLGAELMKRGPSTTVGCGLKVTSTGASDAGAQPSSMRQRWRRGVSGRVRKMMASGLRPGDAGRLPWA
jgi:hypothetical protein